MEIIVMVVKEVRGIKEEYYFMMDNIKVYLYVNWDGLGERIELKIRFFIENIWYCFLEEKELGYFYFKNF